MQFVAIDLETANPDLSSICQIGLVRYEGTNLVEEWSTLIDPEDQFSPVNVAIHGIEPEMVFGQPKLPQVMGRLRESMADTVSVCHGHFDRVALARGCERYGLPPIQTQWLDSARIARRAWTEFKSSGYGLANLCEKLGYEFQHHDALEDAKAAAFLVLAALKDSKQGLDHWIERVNRPISLDRPREEPIRRDGNPEGELSGEVLVFTGTLAMPRREAADLAANLGAQVDSGVTKSSTILVVGDQDVRKLAGHEKSSKHRKAEQLVFGGQRIRIISESDFQKLVSEPDGG